MRIKAGWLKIFFCFVGVMALAGCATMHSSSYTEKPGLEGDGEFTISPDYKIARDLTELGNPKGKYFEFTMKLADSKIFPGTDKTLEPQNKPVRTERKIFVYVPAAYKDGTPA